MEGLIEIATNVAKVNILTAQHVDNVLKAEKLCFHEEVTLEDALIAIWIVEVTLSFISSVKTHLPSFQESLLFKHGTSILGLSRITGRSNLSTFESSSRLFSHIISSLESQCTIVIGDEEE
eukprot:TRINITY_DN5700_c0_g1_i1.p1 TRINITY_DN5700_c0_g1~~TRINITY_DN5700_c0_g1_i1.p1  ORF type:complete len:121 (-),score=16.59 TRINITY_DN5700_c0_g1_i1:111-473(-)